MKANSTVTEILPSYYFAPRAEVIITSCGHRHLRPTGFVKIGEDFMCPSCEDDKEEDDAESV